MTFERLRVADWVALAAALVLLLVMALDWYSTPMGREARRIQQQNPVHGALGGDVAREVQSEAQLAAQKAERNAWQANGGIDRVILVALLLTAGLGVAAAFFRAAGRRFEPPWTPSALAALGAVICALLVAYRIIQEPGADQVTTVQAGAPLAVAVLGALAFASAAGMRAEESGTEFREPRVRSEPAAPAG
jgi:hypothetical protein